MRYNPVPMALDLNAMWNFRDPAASEAVFRDAISGASPDDALTLKTQIARTYGIRKDFDTARAILSEIEPELVDAGAEPRVRHLIELGRTYCSTTHTAEQRTPEAKDKARECYMGAFDLADSEGLYYLATDALHMMAMIDDQPDHQIEWNRKALDYAFNAPSEEAKKWLGSLSNNLGYALHLAGRYDEALEAFATSRDARKNAGSESGVRVADWMIAWTYRAMGRLDDALQLQLKLEEQCAEANEPDPYVFEELVAIYEAKGEPAKVDEYRAKHAALKS